MGALIALIVAASAPNAADPVARWAPLIAEASRRANVPTEWIERVMRAESGGYPLRDGRPIRSRAGAIGLMQLMPATWLVMRIALRLGADPDRPADNIVAGAMYLRSMYDRFGYPGLFAAYNAGPTRYAAYLTGRARLPNETLAYVDELVGHRSGIAIDGTTRPSELLFALRRDLPGYQTLPVTRPMDDGLFAIRPVSAR